jgi:hypothetical protein
VEGLYKKRIYETGRLPTLMPPWEVVKVEFHMGIVHCFPPPRGLYPKIYNKKLNFRKLATFWATDIFSK